MVSLDRHQNTYMQIDPKKPTTALKTPNSLFWRHMSQLRQTVAMFKLSRRAKGKVVKGVVLVSIEGTCLAYGLK